MCISWKGCCPRPFKTTDTSPRGRNGAREEESTWEIFSTLHSKDLPPYRHLPQGPEAPSLSGNPFRTSNLFSWSDLSPFSLYWPSVHHRLKKYRKKNFSCLKWVIKPFPVSLLHLILPQKKCQIFGISLIDKRLPFHCLISHYKKIDTDPLLLTARM